MGKFNLEMAYINTKVNGQQSALRRAIQFGKDFAHGCNTYGSMEAGIAGHVSEMIPNLQKLDSVTCADKGASLMGDFIFVKSGASHIVNFYTQLRPGSGSLSYDAIQSCFAKWIEFEGRGDTLYIPAIGCGIAGGKRHLVIDAILSAFRNASEDSKDLTVQMWVWDPVLGSESLDLTLIQVYREVYLSEKAAG
ncbi:MAG: hypothetical protein ACRCTP_04185 [Aeromonas popoffii]|uniref:hypothetical protein n=1 Tax=Aeromonas popoffii TaxID=70856 RepID=UPI003F376057